MKKPKCLLLISGGLDSTLALKILQKNNITVQPICFDSYFFSCKAAKKACDNQKAKLREVDIKDVHLKMIKNPKFGYGSAHNPCIDCHLMMLKEAKKIMEKEGYDFVATGEVLGQRPMSQNINSLFLIEKEAGLVNQIVRPLSLKLLPETEAEKKQLINRNGFYGISGRGRKEQIKLAEELGIKEYPSPSGGCILTDKNYGKLLLKLFQLKPRANGDDCSIIKQGRVVFDDYCAIVVARNQAESVAIEKSRKRGDIVFIPENFSGPTILIRPIKKIDRKEYIDKGIGLMLKYSKNVPEDFTIEIK